MAVTPTEKKPRASLHSEEKTKKARVFVDLLDEPDCPDEKPDKKARTDDLSELEKLFLKEYAMDEVGGRFDTFLLASANSLAPWVTSVAASQAAQAAAAPTKAMYGHGSVLDPWQPPDSGAAPKSPSLSPERGDQPFQLRRLRSSASGTLEMWDPELDDPDYAP